MYMVYEIVMVEKNIYKYVFPFLHIDMPEQYYA